MRTSTRIVVSALAPAPVAGCSGAGPGAPGTHGSEPSCDLAKLYMSSNEIDQLTVADATSIAADTSHDALLNRASIACRTGARILVRTYARRWV